MFTSLERSCAFRAPCFYRMLSILYISHTHIHTCTHTHAHTIWTRCESFRYCIANLHECIKHVPHFATLLHCSAWHWFTRIASTICFGGLENCYCRVPDKRQKKLLVKVNRVQHFQFLCYSKFAMLFHFYLNAQFWALFGDLFPSRKNWLVLFTVKDYLHESS